VDASKVGTVLREYLAKGHATAEARLVDG